MKIGLIGGTWSFRNDNKPMWHHYNSEFTKFLQSLGHEVIFGYDRHEERILPFEWPSDIGGIGGSHGLIEWAAVGKSIYDRFVPPLCFNSRIPGSELLIINHSHGLQPSLFAFAQGLQGSMISLCGPVREDMYLPVLQATQNLKCWVSMYSDVSDLIQVAGSQFSLRSPFVRAWKYSDYVIDTPGIGHLGYTDFPANFDKVAEAIRLVEKHNVNT